MCFKIYVQNITTQLSRYNQIDLNNNKKISSSDIKIITELKPQENIKQAIQYQIQTIKIS